MLVGHVEATLRPHRIDNPGQTWIQARLDSALGGTSDHHTDQTVHRSEIMAVVAEIDDEMSAERAQRR